MKLGLIVEGQGEVAALPILVRRLVPDVTVSPPWRVRRHQMSHPSLALLEKAVQGLARQLDDGDGILVVADADEDCAVELAKTLRKRCGGLPRRRRLAVVIANREFEAWLAAGAATLAGRRDLPATLVPPEDPDSLRNPKEWFASRMPQRYQETLHQPAFAASFDVEAARSSRSFRKFVKEVTRLARGDGG